MSVRLGDTIVSGLGDQIPSQTSQDGKFLTTNGTTASWAEVPPSTTITYWDD